MAGDVMSRISPELSNGKLGDGEFATNSRTDFRNLALLPDRLSPEFVTTKFEVLKPLPPIVLRGQIKPWFDQPGLGKQYFFDKGMHQNVDAGYLKAVP